MRQGSNIQCKSTIPWFVVAIFTAATAIFVAKQGSGEPPQWSVLPIEGALKDLLLCHNKKGEKPQEHCFVQAQNLVQALAYRPPDQKMQLYLSKFIVQVVGNTLIYRKNECRLSDLADGSITLNVWAADPASLPERWRPYSFQSLDFDFKKVGYNVAGICMAVVSIPVWKISKIVTGHYVRGERDYRWRAVMEPPQWSVLPIEGALKDLLLCHNKKGEKLQEHCFVQAQNLVQALAYQPPDQKVQLYPSKFIVQVVGNTLIYRKNECRLSDLTDDPITLNVWAADPASLPKQRRPHGFQSLDFDFKKVGHNVAGICMAVVPLPVWATSKIVTGHYVRGERDYLWRWRAVIKF